MEVSVSHKLSYSGFSETSVGSNTLMPVELLPSVASNYTVQSRQIQPQNGFSSVWSASSVPIEFIVSPNSVDVINRYYLDIGFENTTGTAIAMLPSFFAFEHYEIEISGQIVHRRYPLELWNNWLARTTSQDATNTQTLVLYDDYAGSTFSGYSLGTGATGSMIVPLQNCFSGLDQGLLISSVKNPIKLRFWTNPVSQFVVTAAGTISMTSISLIVQGLSLSSERLAMSQANYRSYKHAFPFINPGVVKTLNIGSLAANTESGLFVLNAPQSLVSYLLTVVYDQNSATIATPLTPIKLNKLTFLDNQSSQVLYENTRSRLTFSESQQFPLSNQALGTYHASGAQYLFFSSHPHASLSNSCSFGSRGIYGSESLTFNSPSSLTNGIAYVYMGQLCVFEVGSAGGQVNFYVRIN